MLANCQELTVSKDSERGKTGNEFTICQSQIMTRATSVNWDSDNT